MDSRMDSILDKCLEALRQGETVEVCLARHPEDVEWLEPLLRLASDIQDLAPREPLPADVVAASRAEFLAQATKLRSAVSLSTLERMRAGYQHLGLWQRVAVTAATVLVMLGILGGGAALASPGGASGFFGQISAGFRSLFGQETSVECQDRVRAAFERRFEELDREREELVLHAEEALDELENQLAAALQEVEDDSADDLAELEAEANDALLDLEGDQAEDADDEDRDRDDDEDADDEEEDADGHEGDREGDDGDREGRDDGDEAAADDDDEADDEDEADDDEADDEVLERDREEQEIFGELERERLEILADAERERQELLDEFEEERGEIESELAEALAELDAEQQELEEELEEELQECLDGDDDHDVDDEELNFQGTVESIGDDLWVISGVSFLVSEETELDEGAVVDAEARVEYVEQGDGSFLALEIQIDEGDD